MVLSFRMTDFAVYVPSDLDSICVDVITCMNYAYASGYKSIRIFLKNEFAYKCLALWSPGWSRRAYPRFIGPWLNSKGKFFM